MAWYNANWQYRVKITIQASQVDSTLTDFPVYVDLSDLPADFHTNVKSDGGDIRVTRSDGETECARELVSYDSSTDTGELHFTANSLSSSSNTDFYIYYGNSGASDYAVGDTYGRDNVWSDYIAVFHLNEAANTDTDGYLDSTGNGHDGTGTSMSASEVTGQLGKAADFDGSDDVIIGDDISALDGASRFTVSAWVNQDSTPSRGWIFSNGVDDIGERMSLVPWSNNNLYLEIHGSSNRGYYDYTSDVSTSFGHVCMVFDGAQSTNATRLKFYFNSDPRTLTYAGTIPSTTGNNSGESISIGAQESGGQYHSGNIDELRLSTQSLSPDWISAEYTNQKTPTTFYTVGSQETGTTTITKTTTTKTRIQSRTEQSSTARTRIQQDATQTATVKGDMIIRNEQQATTKTNIYKEVTNMVAPSILNGAPLNTTTLNGINTGFITYDASCTTTARISVTHPKPAQALARIKTTVSRDGQTQGRIQITTTQSATAKGFLIGLTTVTATARGSILQELSKTVTSGARLIDSIDAEKPILSGLPLPFPSRSIIGRVINEVEHETINGDTKQYQYNRKYEYILSWDYLHNDDYTALEDVINGNMGEMFFSYAKWPQSRGGVKVIANISKRGLRHGTGDDNFWSSVEITLTEVQP